MRNTLSFGNNKSKGCGPSVHKSWSGKEIELMLIIGLAQHNYAYECETRLKHTLDFGAEKNEEWRMHMLMKSTLVFSRDLI